MMLVFSPFFVCKLISAVGAPRQATSAAGQPTSRAFLLVSTPRVLTQGEAGDKRSGGALNRPDHQTGRIKKVKQKLYIVKN
jgi:hypothetical protein